MAYSAAIHMIPGSFRYGNYHVDTKLLLDQQWHYFGVSIYIYILLFLSCLSEAIMFTKGFTHVPLLLLDQSRF